MMRGFVDTKTFCPLCQPHSNHRDLSDMRNELARTSHSVQVSCSSLSSTLHSREGGAALALEREKALRVQLEQQLRERVGEMMNFQMRTDAEKSELSLRSVTVFSGLTGSVSLPTLLSVRTASTCRLSDSVREGERLKGQIEERDREITALMRKLKVRCRFSGHSKCKNTVKCFFIFVKHFFGST